MQLFRGEFIFPPEGLITNLEKTLRSLEADDVISITRDNSGVPQYVELSDAERMCGRENYDFYCFLIWPFIEASWLGAVSLLGLTPPLDGPQNIWIDNKKAQDSAQLVGCRVFICKQHVWDIQLLTSYVAWQNSLSSRRSLVLRSC
jgi:hypothetical protein